MRRYNVLIADDNKHFLNAFKFLLRESNLEKTDSIFTAADGNEALLSLQVNPIDIAFIDVDLPGMNGVEVTRKATELNRYLTIIAVSFHSEIEFISQMINAGAKNYIVKEEINKNLLNKIFENL
jgi:YesN/AraC family two-component response regulator